jgi:hypothetical protein
MLRIPALALVLALVAAGCMTTDPVTGQQKVDPVPTAAAVAGAAAVGALIYVATDDDDENDDHHHGRYYRSRPFSPNPGVTCYPDQKRCYDQNGYAKKWTRRTFGD